MSKLVEFMKNTVQIIEHQKHLDILRELKNYVQLYQRTKLLDTN